MQRKLIHLCRNIDLHKSLCNHLFCEFHNHLLFSKQSHGNIIHVAYGEKSPDGRQFNKSDDISKAFEATAAYDQLFYEMLTDTDKAIEFIKGILPVDVSKEIEKEVNKVAALPAT